MVTATTTRQYLRRIASATRAPFKISQSLSVRVRLIQITRVFVKRLYVITLIRASSRSPAAGTTLRQTTKTLRMTIKSIKTAIPTIKVTMDSKPRTTNSMSMAGRITCHSKRSHFQPNKCSTILKSPMIWFVTAIDSNLKMKRPHQTL